MIEHGNRKNNISTFQPALPDTPDKPPEGTRLPEMHSVVVEQNFESKKRTQFQLAGLPTASQVWI